MKLNSSEIRNKKEGIRDHAMSETETKSKIQAIEWKKYDNRKMNNKHPQANTTIVCTIDCYQKHGSEQQKKIYVL